MASQYEQEESNQLSTTIEDLNDLSLTDNMHCSDCPATRLPIEIIVYLMEFLSYTDRLAASKTCKHWYEAMRYPKFLDQEKVLVRKNVTDYQAAYRNPSRPYPHLVLIHLEISPKARDYWLRIAPGLKSLYLNDCDISEKMFVDMLSRCQQLESLGLDNCRELFMSGRLLSEPDDVKAVRKTLHGIREVNLSYNRYLSDSLLNRLVTMMPNLETISMEGCQISYHVGLYNKYYPEMITAANPDFASDNVLTFKNFYKLIERGAKTIRVINLSNTLVDSTSLWSIAEIKGLHLTEFHANACEQLTDAGVISLARHQHGMSELNLSRCVRITDEALFELCEGLPCLQRLRLRSCPAITDRGIVQLCRLEYLSELDISMCEQVTGEGIEMGLCYEVNKKFRRLVMEGLTTITSETVITIAKTLPDLTHLDLSHCRNAVTDESIQAIFCNQRRLRCLRLAGCDQLTDVGLTGLGIELVREVEAIGTMTIVDEVPRRLLISLNSDAAQEIMKDAQHNETVQEPCEFWLSDVEGYSLAQLTGLQDLDLRNCNRISDISLKYAFRLVELHHLNLSKCEQITVEGLRELVASCPSIDTLCLAQCYNIADEGIESVVKNLAGLKHLNIKGCNRLTGATVDAILRHCRKLRYLDVTLCDKMSACVMAQINRMPATTIYSEVEIEPFFQPPAPPLPR